MRLRPCRAQMARHYRRAEPENLSGFRLTAGQPSGEPAPIRSVAARPQGTTGVLTLRSDWDSCV
jgi:hypothetical protein